MIFISNVWCEPALGRTDTDKEARFIVVGYGYSRCKILECMNSMA